jgi:ubiquitin-activating enzyme E1
MENLYDRQLRTYGMDAVKNISSSSVLIYGLMGGYATEIGKNLALSGINTIYLYDENNITELDTETGFYYDKKNINENRSKVLANKLQELNPYISVKSTDNYKLDQQVTILINQDIDFVIKMNNYTRSINTKMVCLYSKSISGVVFCDAGQEHIVSDTTSENIENVNIGSISEDGLVILIPNTTHDFQTGDTIELINLEGNNIINMKRRYTITNKNKHSFILNNFNHKNFNIINGSCMYIKIPKIVNHETFEKQIINPKIIFNNDYELSRKIINSYLLKYSNNYNIKGEIDNEYYNTFNFELMPVISLLGSIVASEVIKLVSFKYIPCDQWLVWYDNNLLPKDDTHDKLKRRELEEKLSCARIFVVGSGAIGCEILKNLAFMNIANKPKGQVIITDPDCIVLSNLNRQFLFRPKDIGKNKSEIAVESILKMKKDFNIISNNIKVGNDTINYTENIIKNVDLVINCLDNIPARKFMDELCFKFNIPLFESGTTGTKGSTQPVIPFITETYSALTDPEQNKLFPLCTIKSFPNTIQHTIHWALDQFEFFNRAPTHNLKNIHKYYLDSLQDIEKEIAISDIKIFTELYPFYKNKYYTILYAIDTFNKNYYYDIIDLLETHKPDEEITPGVLFWSNGKKCPHPIKFDIKNQLHLDYVIATSHILSKCCGIDYISSEEIIMFISSNMKIENNNIDNNIKQVKYNPQIFDKDNDNNHIKWITYSSNIRASVYNIIPATEMETKGIAGRIIPAIPTTTSAVAGLIILELLKYMLGKDKLSCYTSTFINLADPIIVQTEPFAAPLIDVCGMKINSWTKFEYKENSTLKKFKEYYENIFKTTIEMILVDSEILYADFINQNCLNTNLKDLIKSKNPVLTLMSNDKELPTISLSI